MEQQHNAGLVITDVSVFLNPEEDEHLKAFASITFNKEFVVADLKVINGNKGLFVAMPARRRKDGTFHDVAHPITPRSRAMVEESVLTAYHQQIAPTPVTD